MELWLAASHPTVFLSLTPCLENPIMEGGRARLEGWAGSTSVWRERGADSSPSPENRACRPGPGCSDRPMSVGALWHTTEPAQATVSDDSLGYASCKEGFYRRGDVNHGDFCSGTVLAHWSPQLPQMTVRWETTHENHDLKEQCCLQCCLFFNNPKSRLLSHLWSLNILIWQVVNLNFRSVSLSVCPRGVWVCVCILFRSGSPETLCLCSWAHINSHRPSYYSF